MKLKTKRTKPKTIYSKRVWRVLPRSVIGISFALVMAAGGALTAAAILYTRFDYSLRQNAEVTQLAISEFTTKNEEFSTDLEEKKISLDKVLDNFTESVADPATIASLSDKFKDTIVEIETEDVNGNTVVFSGFVFSYDIETNSTYILTSSIMLDASKALPSPGIEVKYSTGSARATLENFDDTRDVAVIKITGVQLETAQWASQDVRSESWGDVAYIVSGFSSQESLVVPSRILDYSEIASRFQGPVSSEQAGGVVVTASGEVLGVVTKFWNPSGLDSPQMPYSISYDGMCDSGVVEC